MFFKLSSANIVNTLFIIIFMGLPQQAFAENSNNKHDIYNKLSEEVRFIPIDNQRGLSRVDTSPRIDTFALMRSIMKLAGPLYVVTVTSLKTQYVIKQDYLNLTVNTKETGYLTLLSVGSSGNIFQLFPNNFDQDNHIESGETLMLPRAKWRIRSNGPAGINRFVAIITSSPNKFEGLGIPAGPFLKFDNTETTIEKFIARLSAKDKHCLSVNEKARDFIIEEAKNCESSYGAAIVDIVEIEI